MRRIKAETGLLVGLQTPPHRDLERYDALRAMGVNRVSFCFEIFDRKLFAEICPGKHREYGLDHYLEAVRYCAALGRRGRATSRGWRTARSSPGWSRRSRRSPPSTGSSRWARSRRSASSARWSGTDLQDVPPPQTEDLVPVFRRLYEACMEKGLPIGCAPNIHVSLVLLPEECRSLSPRRFPLQTLKLKLIGAAVRRMMTRRLAAADA